jgi:hypothetical protein
MVSSEVQTVSGSESYTNRETDRAIFYLIPSIWLYKYSSAISRFLGGGGATELGNALVYQKSFWKFVGIMIVIAMIVGIFVILAAVFIPSLLKFLN